MLTPTAQRVARNTAEEINRDIASRTEQRVEELTREEVSPLDLRLGELEQEWDIERTLQFNAAGITAGSLALGAAVHPRISVFPLVIASFLLQHALQGWCPPVPVFRRLGVRTAREIEEERQALKVLRGDYAGLGGSRNAAALLEAARK